MKNAMFARSLYDRDPAGVDPGELLEPRQKDLTVVEKVPGTAMQCSCGPRPGDASGGSLLSTSAGGGGWHIGGSGAKAGC